MFFEKMSDDHVSGLHQKVSAVYNIERFWDRKEDEFIHDPITSGPIQYPFFTVDVSMYQLYRKHLKTYNLYIHAYVV